MTYDLDRRRFVGGLAGAAVLGTSARGAVAQVAKPAAPLTISVIDAAGSLALTQPVFENYRKAKPDFVNRFTFTKAPSPELPGKLKAQQNAGRVDIDIALVGTDAISAGAEQKVWTKLFPDHAAALPKPTDIYSSDVQRMQAITQGQGVCIAFTPSGPLLEYMPDRVKTPPNTAAELLDWCRQNPNRFFYARPSNSGPARGFLMAVPYLLGDANPKDPAKGWDKTWAYLKELNKCIEYYPTGTAVTMKELGDGSRDMITSTMGWDINPRALGIVPKEAKTIALKGTHFIADAHFVAVPAGIAPERMAVILDLVSFMLSPEQQALAYDEGYLYPGPSVKNVPLTAAPANSQKTLAEFGRPEYATLISSVPVEMPLELPEMVQAFRIWDTEIAGKKSP
ncbi:ABC transporter substrate-binding protein [Alsobacter metallidurans]|uniref:ABC transporter substrate-binding protein n=1 Tax=Alsobacter metallidurans TaxID=340221 RepID=A0A917I3R6_9HYPH|nr:extracellular solute-binding protein [Alsobacter metallidurans]GGH07217.1 ABC transporter substrate-binding protein [Alsobacter metallidurans]